MTKKWMILATVLLLILQGAAQKVDVPFTDDAWSFPEGSEYEQVTYQGKEALHLKRGGAFLEDLDFHNGIIEMDICFSEARGFPGFYFRIVDDFNAEEFYLRPHQSGNPDAFQYTPMFNGVSAWQLYHGPGYSKVHTFGFNQWFHLKMVVQGTQAEIYFNGEATPSFQIPELKLGDVRGGIGIRASLSDVYFANFSYTQSVSIALMSSFTQPEKMKSNRVGEWSIFGPVTENNDLLYQNNGNSRFRNCSTESTGLLNIAKFVKKEDSLNTALVKVTIVSNSKQTKQLNIGYSDRARVYCNGNILYSGQRKFRTRDYRYLGTIGIFDAVYLPLQKGTNELVIAVSEDFGGWGLLAEFESMEGITLTTE